MYVRRVRCRVVVWSIVENAARIDLEAKMEDDKIEVRQEVQATRSDFEGLLKR